MIDTSEFNEMQQRLYETLKFLGKLVFAGLVFRLILYIYPDTTAVQVAFAQFMAGLLNSSIVPASSDGIFVLTETSRYIITQDCLGWKSAAVFVGLIYASTTRTLEHLNVLLQGLAVIVIANVIRVYSTIVLAEKGIISFQLIHDVLWKWSLTALVLVMWIYWMRNLKDREPVYQQRIRARVRKLQQNRR